MDVLWQSLVVITRGSLSLASWLLSVLLSISQLRLTLTFDAAGLGLLTLILCLSLWLLARYRFLNPYSRLPALGRGAGPSAPFDLHPDVVSGEEQDPSKASYPDELMGAFLSSIRVFGYLDKQVFSELARNLESRKLKAGETLFSSTKDDEIDRDFYVVVEGRVAIYVKGQRNASGKYNAAPSSDTESDDADMMDDDPEHHHLLNEVESGGTVSSLFSILSVFTESLDSALWPSKNTEDQGANEENETTEEETPLATPLAAPKLSASPMKVDSIDNGSSPPPKEDRKKSEKRARKEERPVSVHPDIIARATVDTTLAVIPARAFQQLTAKYPSAAAHIVQVILARFQRVTFMTLYRYLGLSKELLRIEKRVNEMAGAPEIAADLPDREAIDRLHRYLTRGSSSPAEDGELRAEDGIDDRASLRSRPNLKKNFSKRSSGPSQVVSSAAPHHRILPSMRESGDESDTSTIDSAPCIRRGPPLNNTSTRKRPSNGAFSHLLDEEDGDGHNTLDDEDAAAHERLRETVYDFMMRLIGAVPTEELIANAAEDGTTSQTHTSNSALPSSDLLLTPTQKRHGSVSPANTALYPRLFRRGSSRNGSSVTFPLVKKNTTLYSDGGNSTTGTASPTASSASVLGEPMIDIVFYPRGSILIKEGERLQGLYFVLDGILEASMRGNVNPTDTLTNLDEVPSRKSLFFVTTGGLAGYLAAITGTTHLLIVLQGRLNIYRSPFLYYD